MSDAELVQQLAADLRKYGQCLHECAAWGPYASLGGGSRQRPYRPPLPEKCNCGLVPALERANAVRS